MLIFFVLSSQKLMMAIFASNRFPQSQHSSSFLQKKDKRSIENIHQHIEPFTTLHPHWRSHTGWAFCILTASFTMTGFPNFAASWMTLAFSLQSHRLTNGKQLTEGWADEKVINTKKKLVLIYLWAVSLGNISYTWQYMYTHNTKNMPILYFSIVNIMPFLIQTIWKT